jgi:hypothetical protein
MTPSWAGPLSGLSVGHIGHLVPDARAAVDHMQSLGFRVAPIKWLRMSDGSTDDVRLVVGFALIGGLLTEFIEPPGGGDVWSSQLRGGGPGLHHIGFANLPDLPDALGRLQQDGYRIEAEGHHSDSSWYYVRRGAMRFELTDGTGPQFPTAVA